MAFFALLDSSFFTVQRVQAITNKLNHATRTNDSIVHDFFFAVDYGGLKSLLDLKSEISLKKSKILVDPYLLFK